MIKGIYIENFKGIGEPGIKLDLEPVTLLFGSNSAGKSSVFHAFLLAYEILVRGNRNPDRTELGGSVIDLGGFRRFIHQQQMHRKVRLRFDLDMASVSFDQEWPIAEHLIQINPLHPEAKELDLSKTGEDIWKASVEVSLMWDDLRGVAFVAEYAVDVDSHRLATITDRRDSSDGPGLVVNPLHPVFVWPDGTTMDSLGILDDLDSRFRTKLQGLFFTSEQADVSGLHDILEDREEWQQYDAENEVFDLKWEAIEDRVLEEDDWESEEFQRSRPYDDEDDFDDEDDRLHSNADSDSDDDEDHDEISDLQGTTVVSRGGFVIEAELMSRIEEAGEVEVRRAVVADSNGREVETFLFRRQSDGVIGIWAFYFPERGGWLRPEANVFVDQWKDSMGVNALGEDLGWTPLLLEKRPDALPSFDESLVIKREVAESDEDSRLIDDRFICQLLSRLILVPGRIVAESLELSRYIGPLREIPGRQFVSPTTPDASRWSTGLAAWDYLNQCSDETVEEISRWLADEKRLGTRHGIIRTRFRELPSDSFEISKLASDDYLDELERIRDAILSRREISKIQLHDQTLNVKIDPHDCAIGIAQLVPVVVAGVMSKTEPEKRGLFMIEQPELHNHPSVEVGLGDLFVETIQENRSRFILETHGEHLMLRILRRIRETTEGSLPEGTKGLLPDEVAVYFIERKATGVSTTRLRVDESGEFIDKWPNGFFRERGKELF